MKTIVFFISVMLCFSVFAQTTITFSGNVELWNKNDHSNITVAIDGFTAHASGVTDQDGNYSISYTYQCTTLPVVGTQCDNNVKITFSYNDLWEEVNLTFTNVTTDMEVEDVYLALKNSTTEICMLTHDSTTDNVLVIWERYADADIDYMIISKFDPISGSYEKIGTHDYSLPGIFEDVNTSKTSGEKYKITPVMNSGDTSMTSKPKRSLFLKIDSSKVVGDNIEVSLTLSGIADLNLLSLPDSLIVYKSTAIGSISPSRFDFNKYISSLGANIQDVLRNDRIRITETLSKTEVTYLQVGLYYEEMCIPSILKTDSGPFSQSISNITESEISTSIVDLNTKNILTITPNPSKRGTTVNIPFAGKLSLISIEGKVIFETKVEKGVFFIPQQNEGVYKLILTGTNQVEKTILFE